jgi:Zn-dependent peptidase ImmA (M78 family)
VRSKIRRSVAAQAKLTISATNMMKSQRKERWKSFGHAEMTLVKAGRAT